MVHTCVAPVEVFRQDNEAVFGQDKYIPYIGELAWKYLCKTIKNHALEAVMELHMLGK